jgi:hypothetical protein
MNIDLSFDPTQFILGINYYPKSDIYVYSEVNIFLTFFRLSLKF